VAVRAGHKSCMTAGHVDDIVDTHRGFSYCEEVGWFFMPREVGKPLFFITKSGA
jgi:hypothetical protein